MSWLPCRRWPCNRSPRPGRPGLERLEDRTLPASFSFHGGWLSLVGQTASLTQTSAGQVAVRIDAAATAVPASELRGITLTGSGSSDILTLGRLHARRDLTIVSDGAISVRGRVQAGGALKLRAASLLDIDSGAALAGGTVTATARDYLSAGTVRAGGRVSVAFGQSYIDTSAARTSGGRVSIHGSGRLFSSGRFSATGTSGGQIELSGGSVALVAAALDASGSAGQGGRVVVWSRQSTDFAGTISARGSVGGFVEVSSHGTLSNRGRVDVGPGGTLRLDPLNLIISAPGGRFPQFNLVNPGSGGAFGTAVVPLSTGNVVVSDPKANSNAGAVYLFNGITGALVSTLAGLITGINGDQVGSGGIKALSNGDFVVISPHWRTGDGAVTWVDGSRGLSGLVDAGNSLTGTNPGDSLGSSGVTALTNGNYVVASPGWNNGVGAVTWGSGTAGVHGIITSANSLLGSKSGDEVGTTPVGLGGVAALSNGNYVVDSPSWDNGAGAVTWGSGTIGVHGTISANNSLVGSTGSQFGFSGDAVGSQLITTLPNGNYIVDSPDWNGGMGAVTWASGTTGVQGAVSASNSLVGHLTGDGVGSGSIAVLTNDNYVVVSRHWNGDQGAVTWASGTAGITGPVTPVNSLVGGRPGDQVGGVPAGESAVTPLSNGNYVVASPQWNGNEGAATWVDGSTGISGPVTPANSLVGSAAGDFVGGADPTGLSGGPLGSITALSNGNYVVASPQWNGRAGAATWGSGVSGVTGVISASNSLVGNPGDQVGAGVTALTNGNYVVASPSWSGKAGAATWGSGTGGTTGTISSSNSLIGSSGDQVGLGGATALSNGNYVVVSPSWNNNVGAVTWGSGTSGVTGTVSDTNSLVGTSGGNSGDQVGSFGVTALSNGNYVVASPSWNNSQGAVTWGNGSNGIVGTVSGLNSLLGTVAGDQMGESGITALGNGNYVVSSPSWNGGRGAATWGNGGTGATLDGLNAIDPQNSLIGAVPSAGLSPLVGGTPIGSFLAPFTTENGGRVTLGFTNPNQITASLAQKQTISITPAFLANPLEAGAAVDLRASNSLTVASPISVGAVGLAGALTLEAATIVLNADVSTDGGNLTFNGLVSPGASKPALIHLDVGAVAFAPRSRLALQLNGTTAGTGFDQLQVNGTLELTNATLALSSVGGFAVGQKFVVIQSNTDVGTAFAGLPEGGLLSAGNQVFKISYKNDQVTLTVQPPVPARLTFLSQPRGGHPNGFMPAFSVQVLDRFGNRLSVPVSLTLVVVKPGLNAHFGPGSVTKVTSVNGLATFAKVSVSVGGQYRLVAHAGSVTAESNVFSFG